MCSASSTSRRPPRSPTAWTRRRMSGSRSTTWAVARSTSPSWKSAIGVFEVKSTNGDTFLGGDDFDLRVMDWLVEEVQKAQGIDLKRDRMARQRLKEPAER